MQRTVVPLKVGMVSTPPLPATGPHWSSADCGLREVDDCGEDGGRSVGSASQTSGTAGRQLLVLGFQKPGPRIGLDGPALRVTVEGRATVYFPLRRVSRIVAGPSAEFRTEAILACAQEGIVIVWQDASRGFVARTVGRTNARSGMRQAVIELLLDPEWQPRYRGWLLETEKRTASLVAQQIEAPSELSLYPDQLRAWIWQAGAFFSGETVEVETRGHFETLAVAWMTKHLQQVGLGGECEAWQSEELDLGRDLTRVFAMRVEPARLAWLRRRHQWATATGRSPRPVRMETAALIWERSEPKISSAGRVLVHSLYRWLVPVQGTDSTCQTTTILQHDGLSRRVL